MSLSIFTFTLISFSDKYCSSGSGVVTSKLLLGILLSTGLTLLFAVVVGTIVVVVPGNVAVLVADNVAVVVGCSGYPDTLGEDNAKEIKINENVLNNAKKYLLKNNKDISVRSGVIDINGSVADYDPCTKKWTLQYQGSGTDSKGLWYNYPFDN